jgi:hypothetical protein
VGANFGGTMSTTLAELREKARNRADMKNSKFVSDLELNDYINSSIAELHDILVEAYNSDYFVESTTFFLVPGQASYDLPDDFYVLKGVDVRINNQEFLSLRPFNFNERNRFNELGVWDLAGITNVRYRLVGDKLRFMPTPSNAAEARLWYVPIAAKLVNDSDTFNALNGYDEYVIVDAAIKMMQKEESDVTVLLAQKQALEKRIRERANIRDSGSTPSISDIYADGDDFFWRGGNN